MTNQFAIRRNQKQSVKRDFFGWIDSELRNKAPEVAGPAIRNTISLSDETEGVKAAQLKYLNKQIEFISSNLALLQEQPEAAPVAALEAPVLTNSTKRETVEAPAPETYSPSKIRSTLQYLFDKTATRKGNPAADNFLLKPSRDEINEILNDETDFDNVKWFIGHTYEQAFNEAFMRRYQLNHADSIKAVNPILKVLDNPTYTQAQKYAYCEIYIKYAHDTDRAPLIAFIEAKLGVQAPVASDTPVADETAQHEAISATTGLSDPRIRGLAYELGMLQECQLWEICEHLSDGSGKVAISAVRAFYREHMSDAKFYDVLNSEHRSLWLRRIDKKKGYIWFKAYDVVSDMLGRLVPADRIVHYLGNNAIGGRVHMPLAGTPQTAMQYAFAAWIERRKKSDAVTLANRTMADIWGVSVRTIRRWKQLCNQQNNFAEQAPITDAKRQINPDVPPHAIDTQTGGKLYQISSSYTPPGDVQKHIAKGRSPIARKAFYRAAMVAQEVDSLSAIWATEERSTEKRYWSQDDIPQAFQKVDKTLRKPTSDTFLPRHVRLVTGKRSTVWETFTEAVQRVGAVYVS